MFRIGCTHVVVHFNRTDTMLLTQIEIRNFRGIKELRLPLDDLCVLIGENNSGKSTVLDAVRICLSRPFTQSATVFEEYDFHLPEPDSEPSKVNTIVITLTFSEKQEGEWPREIAQILGDAAQIDDHGLLSVRLRVRGSFDRGTNSYAAEYDFLDLSYNPVLKARNSLARFRRTTPVFYLASLRDAAKEFRARSQFWGPFVRSLDLEEEDRTKLEMALSELNREILQRHSTFESVKERMKEMADYLPLGESDPVSIEAIPSKVFDILSRTQIKLASKTGARIPIVRHGSGTQSLAVIYLFAAFLNSKLSDAYGEYSEPVLALEEPEAHLHPSAINSVVKMLRDIPGQKLVSTHSGDLLTGVPLRNIRRLRRSDGSISVYRVDESTFEEEDIEKLNYKVRITRGALLFSRCWLLVEGETEALLLPECARAMGYDLHADGVSLIEFSQIGVAKLIRLADQLGIEWVTLVDNDKQGSVYQKSAEDLISERREKSNHSYMLDHGNMEVFLCMEGFGDIYKSTVSEQKKSDITAEEGTPEYWKQVVKAQKSKFKPINSLAIAKAIMVGGHEAVPKLLADVINRSRNLAKSVG